MPPASLHHARGAHRAHEGVMIPSVSAGSSQREASVMWTAHVTVLRARPRRGPRRPHQDQHRSVTRRREDETHGFFPRRMSSGDSSARAGGAQGDATCATRRGDMCYPPGLPLAVQEVKMADVQISLTCATRPRDAARDREVKPEGIALTMILGSRGRGRRARRAAPAVQDETVQGGEWSMAQYLYRIEKGDRSTSPAVFPCAISPRATSTFAGAARSAGPKTWPARIGMYSTPPAARSGIATSASWASTRRHRVVDRGHRHTLVGAEDGRSPRA